MKRESLYQRLPRPLQDMAVSLEGWRLNRRRYGSNYASINRLVTQRNFQVTSAVGAFQKVRARNHFQAAKNCPFWCEIFKQYRIALDKDPLEELHKLPILTKEDVRKNVAVIKNPTISTAELIACHTSGTTGSGLVFWETEAAEKERWAVWWRYREWHNITQEMWCGYFGGRLVVPLTQSRSPFWRFNYSGRQILFSGYHLSDSTAEEYLTALDKYSPPWLHGYPSLLSLLASYLLERGRPLREAPFVITTGAENLLPQQKDLIQKAFGCPVRQHYGQAESVANISECPSGHLHVDEDFSFVEFLPSDDQPDVFRIVGTNWSNPAFPLIRYDTGDRVSFSRESLSCRMTGRVVESIDGRKEDYVVLPSGARLGRLDHIFKDLTQIREAQIYQSDRKTIIFRIVKREGYSPEDERRLFDEAHKRLGREVTIKLEYVLSLERSRTGKLRFVVSEVS